MATGYYPIIGPSGECLLSDPSLMCLVVPFDYVVTIEGLGFGGSGGMAVGTCDIPEGVVETPDQADYQVNQWQDMLTTIQAAGEQQRQQFETLQQQTQRLIAEQQRQRAEDTRLQQEQIASLQGMAERTRQQIDEDQRALQDTLNTVVQAVSQPKPEPAKEPEVKQKSDLTLPSNLGSINPITVAGAEAIKDHVVERAVSFGIGWAANKLMPGKKKRKRRGKK